MDKGLFFFIMAIACLYILLDEFAGKSRISNVAGLMTPDLSIGGLLKDQVKEKVSDTASDLNKKAPDIFYDPKDPKDKAKESYTDALLKELEKQSGRDSA